MKHTLLFIFLCFGLINFSQNVEFNGSVNKKEVNVNEVFTYQIYSTATCQIYQPDFGGLQIVGGPYQQSSTSVMTVNGKTTRQRETTYTYQLRAPKAGNYTIGSSTMTCDQQNYATEKIKISAINGTGQTSGVNTLNSNENKDFFVRVLTTKNKVYQGEPFTLTLKMYSKKQPRGIEELKMGASNGLSKQDLNPAKTTFDTKQEIVDGIRYFTVTLKQELCFALRPGEIDIEPYYISALFSKGFFQQYRAEAYSNSVKIKVKALPGHEPKNFNGLVGSYQMDHSISKTKVKPGEAIDIKLKISGKGNLNAFDEPQLDLPNDFDQFDPEYKEDYKTTSNGYSGSISYNLVVVPTYYGDFTIPAFSFSYFDLNSKSYKSLSTGDFNIHVDKPEDGYGEIISNKKEVELEENDIRYIHNEDSDLMKKNELKGGTIFHFGLIAFPFGLVWLILFLRRKKANLSDEDKQKRIEKSAKKTATKFLSECKKHHNTGDEKLAIKSLNSALKNYLKHKFNLSESELNLKTVLEQIKPADIQKDLSEVWNQIEMYQFAPVNASQFETLMAKTELLIDQIEKQK